MPWPPAGGHGIELLGRGDRLGLTVLPPPGLICGDQHYRSQPGVQYVLGGGTPPRNRRRPQRYRTIGLVSWALVPGNMVSSKSATGGSSSRWRASGCSNAEVSGGASATWSRSTGSGSISTLVRP